MAVLSRLWPRAKANLPLFQDRQKTREYMFEDNLSCSLVRACSFMISEDTNANAQIYAATLR